MIFSRLKSWGVGFGHRQVWQRLPRAWRRAALFQMSTLAAPRPTLHAPPALPIIVAGAFHTASGLGESARLCHDALMAEGIPVFGLDLTAGLMQPVDHPFFDYADGSTLEGPGTLILHVNSPLVPLAMMSIGAKTVRDKHVVGYWAWELPGVPDDWRHGVPFVHEIWTPSRFTADAVQSLAGGRAVRVLAHPVALERRRAQPPATRADARFTVLTIFNTASSFARKNPLATIEAFDRAFDRDPGAHLIVKTFNLMSYPQAGDLIREAAAAAGNITLIEEVLSPAGIDALYAGADAVISLHRSEGFGLTVAEAMLHGVPVLATDWSGNVDFLTTETGLPIPYTLIPAEDPQGTYHYPDMCWADADIDAAAAGLRRLREDCALRARLGAAGAAYAAQAWGAPKYADTVRSHLGLS